jgi:hypothetical protein
MPFQSDGEGTEHAGRGTRRMVLRTRGLGVGSHRHEFLNDLEESFNLCQLHSQNLFQSTGDQRVRRIAKIRLKVAGPGAARQALEPCCTVPLA